MTDRALHKHDCPNCVYLGTITFLPGRGGRDMYVCEPDFTASNYVVRKSSEAHDYISGLCHVGSDPYITLAHMLAERRGLSVAHTLIAAEGYGCGLNLLDILGQAR